MDRRTFIGRFASSLLAAPLTVRARESAIPVVGFLGSVSLDAFGSRVAAFRDGLAETGYMEGRNVAIEFRWAEGKYERLPALATDLVRHGVAILVAVGGAQSALAAEAATSTIPIVFVAGGDPVELGLVARLGRPGGNATGVNLFTTELMAKRLELLHSLVPKAVRVVLLVNPDNPDTERETRKTLEAGRAFGLELHVLTARSEIEIDKAFATFPQIRPGALLIGTDTFFFTRREQFITLAARYAVPAIFETREFATAGGLASYGPNINESYRQAGVYTGKILKGAKPAELPVLQPTKIELVINRKTAKALGITVPQPLLERAEEVIE